MLDEAFNFKRKKNHNVTESFYDALNKLGTINFVIVIICESICVDLSQFFNNMPNFK